MTKTRTTTTTTPAATTTALGEDELARRTPAGGVELCAHPLRARWTFEHLASADDHELRATFACSIRALPDEMERRMLAEVLLADRASATADSVSSHFHRPLASALASAAGSLAVSQIVTDAGRETLLAKLKSAATSVAFAAGVEVLPPFQLDVESPTHQRQQSLAMQRTLAERQAAGQVEHFARATELLKQFHAMRQAAPELSAGQILQRVSPGEQGSLLQTLLLASAKQDEPRELWAVAGQYLVRIDHRTAPAKTSLTLLPVSLGPLRSVRPAEVDGRRTLLVGARSGVMLVDPDSLDTPTVYTEPSIATPLGFGSVAYVADQKSIVGCHGEAGVVRWKVGASNATVETTSRITNEQLRQICASTALNATARNVVSLDDRRVVMSFGSAIVLIDADAPPRAIQTTSTSDVVATIVDDSKLIVVHEDGNVCALDRTTFEIVCRQRAGGRVRAAAGLPWLGSTRLLLATESAGVKCVGLDDPLVTQYTGAHADAMDVRAIAASSEVVAAVSGDRQRLTLWNTWDGRAPLAEIYLTGVTRHRTADVAFG